MRARTPRLALLTGMRSLLVAAALLAACDSQVDGDHQGEVLATLEGALRSERAVPLPDPEVAIVWAQNSMMGNLVGAETVEAEGLFPNFTLSVFSPPPDAVLEEIDGEHYAIGFVVVGSVGTDYRVHTNWHGVDYDRIVIYLPEDTAVEGTLGYLLHGAQPAGFHVYTVKNLTEPERQAKLDCINMRAQGSMISSHDMFKYCGGNSGDEIYPAPADLETQFDIAIVEDASIIDLINNQPRW